MGRVDYRDGGAIPDKQLLELFAALGWTHLNDLLPQLLLNSTYVASAWDGARLVGLSRVVSDRVYISMLLQVGVHPDYQRHGLGTELVRRCIEHYPKTNFILTTDDTSNETFYQRFGFQSIGSAMIRHRR